MGNRADLGTTRPGALLKQQIPLRTFADWDDLKVGFMEADLVAHCGHTLQGAFLNTLVLTDVSTGWTECLALLFRGQESVMSALGQARSLLPFPLLGLDTDNGSEFLNTELLRYCRAEKITFTRCRPYKKNDQCHVEQKNGSVVRRLVGYDRFEGEAACRQLAMLYGVLRLYVNFFQPSVKLIAKERDGAKLTKKYDSARTPYQRLLSAAEVSAEVKEKLRAEYARLDPVQLLRQLEHSQDLLWRYAHRPAEYIVDPSVEKVAIALPAGPQAALRRQAKRDDKRSGEGPRLYRATKKQRCPFAGPRYWRTCPDPFAGVWVQIKEQLEANPYQETTQIFMGLQRRYPGKFPDSLVRTLQRRVRAWRLERSGYCEGVLLPGDIINAGEMTTLEGKVLT